MLDGNNNSKALIFREQYPNFIYHNFKIGICSNAKAWHDRENRNNNYYVFNPNNSQKDLFILYSNIKKFFSTDFIFSLC